MNKELARDVARTYNEWLLEYDAAMYNSSFDLDGPVPTAFSSFNEELIQNLANYYSLSIDETLSILENMVWDR